MASDLVLVQGLRDTRGTLARWNTRPLAIVGPWFAGAAAVCAGLLVAVVVVAHFATPDPSGALLPGYNEDPTLGDVGGILFRNSLVLGLPVHDLTGGFKCFRAEVLQAIDLPTVRAHGYAFQVELTNRTIRRGFRVVEVPITFRDRLRGRSKMSSKIALEAMFLVPRLRRTGRSGR